MRWRVAGLVVLSIALAGAPVRGRSPGGFTPPSDSGAISHLLNRAAFGPRPGEVERVRNIGVKTWIEQQLHPERIEDEVLDARTASFTTLRLPTDRLVQLYYEPLETERRIRRQQLSDEAGAPVEAPAVPAARERGRASPTSAEEQARRAADELLEQKILRATFSERQLQEVLVDFWFNHFNVYAGKGRTRYYVLEHERDVIRPHVLGRFRDLLGATAKSPAMLLYLDNWLSVDAKATTSHRPLGLNENYARELLELHTLGVDGGYTQRDVTEVARAFTGWTIDRPGLGGGFVFRARLHDRGEKVVLGERLRAGGGQRDGERVLDLLARHPSTARFISLKLARRFVSDEPPPALVDRLAATFRQTDGDLRQVTRTLLLSTEFFAPDARRAKLKTPLEFVVSALRGLSAHVDDATAVARSLNALGMPLYGAQPPTGYVDREDAWANAGTLVARMNMALAIAQNRMRGVSVTTVGLLPPTTRQDERAVAAVVDRLLDGSVSSATRMTLSRAATPGQLVALALGSPEFQRR